MAEEIKRQGVAVQAKGGQTYAEEIAMWSEKAPMCKCRREKAIYICQD
jgi:hypothetical protein